MAASLAACTTATGGPWTFPPAAPFPSSEPTGTQTPAASVPTPASAAPAETSSASPAPVSPAPSPGASVPAGWTLHDVSAKERVDRFLGGEWERVPGYGNQPIDFTLDGDVKVFNLTVDKISHAIDAVNPPLDALGYNGRWPGPVLRAVEGDKVRFTFRNNLDETTTVHFHGQRTPTKMDGVPFINQDPIVPGGSFTYEFIANPAGSHMYHSHHNATDQVGRGLLGAFVVDPKDPAERYDRKYGVTQEVIWISNDQLGGFTINGRGFPATQPIVAQLGEKVLVRYMNEGIMMHPWHLHGMPMYVVARDGWPLGSASFFCDTLGVNPGERWDAIIDCDNPGPFAWHCHILPHAEGPDGMFGMVTALIVQT